MSPGISGCPKKSFIRYLYFCSLFLAGTVWPAPPEDLGHLAYAIMVSPATPAPQLMERFIALARQEPHWAQIPLPAKGNAVGALMVFTCRADLGTLQQSMITKHKVGIYKSTVFDYGNTLTDQQIGLLAKQDTFTVNFISRYKIYGKYGTRFSYSMKTSVVKRKQWILEREWVQGKPERIKGLGGYLKDLCYIILFVETGRNSTLRVAASWSDAGGDIPVIGKITPSYDNIYEGLITGYKDVVDYFRLPE